MEKHDGKLALSHLLYVKLLLAVKVFGVLTLQDTRIKVLTKSHQNLRQKVIDSGESNKKNEKQAILKVLFISYI